MKLRLKATPLVILAGLVLAGCGDSSADKQPKLSGTPDPKIKGPVEPGAAPASGKAGQGGKAGTSSE